MEVLSAKHYTPWDGNVLSIFSETVRNSPMRFVAVSTYIHMISYSVKRLQKIEANSRVPAPSGTTKVPPSHLTGGGKGGGVVI